MSVNPGWHFDTSKFGASLVIDQPPDGGTFQCAITKQAITVLGHNYICQGYVGHSCIGHNSMDHSYAGHNCFMAITVLWP